VFVKVIPKRVWTATILAVELQIADEIFSLYRNILEDEKPSVLEVSRSPFSLIVAHLRALTLFHTHTHAHTHTRKVWC
jgi:hypothetical protein